MRLQKKIGSLVTFVALIATIISSGCSSHQEQPGPLERAGASLDTAGTTVAEKSTGVAHEIARGTMSITSKVAHSVGHAAGWVEDRAHPYGKELTPDQAERYGAVIPVTPTVEATPDPSRY